MNIDYIFQWNFKFVKGEITDNKHLNIYTKTKAASRLDQFPTLIENTEIKKM